MQRHASLAAALLLAIVGHVAAAPVARPTPLAAAPKDVETEAFLRQMGDAQKWMGEELWRIKEKVEELPGVVAETKDQEKATQEQLDKIDDEVKGLYVELSTVKQQIEAVRADVDGVNGNLTSFRNSSGVFLALVLVMVFVSTVTTVLRR